MKLLLGTIVFLPLLISILQSRGRSMTSPLSFIASLLVSALFMTIAGEYIGKISLLFALALYYFLFYNLDDDFGIFLDTWVFDKIRTGKT